MGTFKECDLPGIGKKFVIEARSGDKLVVIIHDDGRRELYHFEDNRPDEVISSITLDDEESRQIASIIGGMNYSPKALESTEVSLNDLVIEWYKIEPSFKSVGKTIAELQVRQQTGAMIIAIVGKHKQKINPGPEELLLEGLTLVIAGERQQIKQLKELLNG